MTAAALDRHHLESAIARWDDAVLAASLFALAPSRCGGIIVRGQSGPVRDRWFALLSGSIDDAMPRRRVPIDVSEGRLIGGLDFAATLVNGRTIAEHGLLAETNGGILILPSAERAGATTLSAIAGALDDAVVRVERDGVTATNAAEFGVIAFDESRGDDAPVASLLGDRLAMVVDLDAIPFSVTDSGTNPTFHRIARGAFGTVTIQDAEIEALCALSIAFGIASLRAPIHAVYIARAFAVLNDRTAVDREDLEAAVRLVLVPRATQVPADDSADAQQEPSTPPPADGAQASSDDNVQPEEPELQELLLAAARAALPPGLLENLQRSAALRKAKAKSGHSGAVKSARHRRGRRDGSRRGDPRSGGTLDLLETVRAAAPWQAVRKRDRQNRQSWVASTDTAPVPRLEVRRDDFRIRRFKHQSETATIFVVDASGSSALHRLAEAKGAVELLLADCYARRDQVALIAFRGKRADLLLPPTRSLVRAKRSLAGLPGGGGTPLAIATDEARALGRSVLLKGQTPTLVFLTDGRANINREGLAGRPAAISDALAAARALKAEGIPSIVIDTSTHAGLESRTFAGAMGATYLPLPHADAVSLSSAVRHASG